MIQRRETRKALAPEDINRQIVERFYQERAIRRVAEAFATSSVRRFSSWPLAPARPAPSSPSRIC